MKTYLIIWIIFGIFIVILVFAYIIECIIQKSDKKLDDKYKETERWEALFKDIKRIKGYELSKDTAYFNLDDRYQIVVFDYENPDLRKASLFSFDTPNDNPKCLLSSYNIEMSRLLAKNLVENWIDKKYGN